VLWDEIVLAVVVYSLKLFCYCYRVHWMCSQTGMHESVVIVERGTQCSRFEEHEYQSHILIDVIYIKTSQVSDFCTRYDCCYRVSSLSCLR
jgi:hypothetical protein